MLRRWVQASTGAAPLHRSIRRSQHEAQRSIWSCTLAHLAVSKRNKPLAFHQLMTRGFGYCIFENHLRSSHTRGPIHACPLGENSSRCHLGHCHRRLSLGYQDPARGVNSQSIGERQSIAFLTTDAPTPAPVQLRASRSMPVGKTDRERDGADENEARGPDPVQVEPASRDELQSEIAVHKPRGACAGGDHCDRVSD